MTEPDSPLAWCVLLVLFIIGIVRVIKRIEEEKREADLEDEAFWIHKDGHL